MLTLNFVPNVLHAVQSIKRRTTSMPLIVIDAREVSVIFAIRI